MLAEVEVKKSITRVHKGSGDLAKLHQTGWNILKEEVSLPVAVLSQRALTNNLDWMQSFARRSNVGLAPHGKTTMAPELYHEQLKQGAWAISLATVPQVIAAYSEGINRVILANQLVGAKNFELIAEMLKDPETDFYCFVDSIENASALNKYFLAQGMTLNVLIEIGVAGGRCGCRNFEQASALAEQIKHLSSLHLAGVSFYEGVIHGTNAEGKIRQFVADIASFTFELEQQGYFDRKQVIISGAGSAWYDIVAEQLGSTLPEGYLALIRPGCYAIHDTGIYQQAQSDVLSRSVLACEFDSELTSSLTIWAYVQSVPEPGLAIVAMGKRDVAFDAGLPTPYLFFHPGSGLPVSAPDDWKLTDIMDQHAMLEVSSGANLMPGDMIAFSTSHPCLTIDKWRFLGVVDDNFTIGRQIETYF